MMVYMSIVAVCLFSVLFIVACAVVFREAPRDMQDVCCFLAMLLASVAIVLVFVVKEL